MKNLGDIIKSINHGEKTEYDELLYSVLALSALLFFENRAIQDLSKAKKENKNPILSYDPIWQANESFNRRKNALNTSPKKYVGWDNDPENPEYIKRIKQSERIFEKIMNEVDKTKKEKEI